MNKRSTRVCFSESGTGTATIIRTPRRQMSAQEIQVMIISVSHC